MTEQEKQKLNEKLANCAGFILYADPTPGIGIHCIRPDKTEGIFDIDFTDSLDACFGWLVPKIIQKMMGELTYDRRSAVKALFRKWLANNPNGTGNPALALCLAIEKLIEQ